MTKKLVWRLREQPTTKMLQELVSTAILTKDEAREILFSSETEEDRDKKSLQSEIKFLRELVEKLSKRSEIVTTIREIEVPYRRYDWYNPYNNWCGGTVDYTVGHDDTTLVHDTGIGWSNTTFANINTF